MQSPSGLIRLCIVIINIQSISGGAILNFVFLKMISHSAIDFICEIQKNFILLMIYLERTRKTCATSPECVADNVYPVVLVKKYIEV